MSQLATDTQNENPGERFLAALRQARKYGFRLFYVGPEEKRARWTRDMIESLFGKEQADVIQKELEEYLHQTLWN